MKMRKGRIIFFLVMIFAVVAGVSAQEKQEKFVPITRLNVAPWLGPIENEKDLADKFAKEKINFASFVKYDLKEAEGLDISTQELKKIIQSLESGIWKTKEILVPDGTSFRSMGWKSNSGQIMRTRNPILRLGRSITGFPVEIRAENFRAKYIFLKECGNLCLQELEIFLPPAAEIVPIVPKENNYNYYNYNYNYNYYSEQRPEQYQRYYYEPPPQYYEPPPRYYEPPRYCEPPQYQKPGFSWFSIIPPMPSFFFVPPRKEKHYHYHFPPRQPQKRLPKTETR